MFDKLPLPTYKEGEYEAYNSGSTEREVGEFLYAMVRMLKPEWVLETGTYKGISAAYMALALKENGRGGLITVEFDKNHWQDAESLWRELGVTQYIDLEKKSVEDLLLLHPVDMLFLDSEPGLRWGELARFYDNLTPGGYAFLHDLPRGFCKGNINPDHPEFQDWPWKPVPSKIMELIYDRKLVPWHFPNPREMAGFYKAHEGDYKI